MRQYTDIGRKLLEEGVWVTNRRTGKRCLTLLDQTFTYSSMPIVTTRKSYWKSAINEMIAYLRGYTDLVDMHELGVKTWDANYNAPSWQRNPNRRHVGDLGKIYGYFIRPNDETDVDQLSDLIDKLKRHEDDRGLILNFWQPGFFDQGCLRPCMFQHHFSILDGKLYLTSYQRSADYPLGMNFNMVQCWFLLQLMAGIAGLEVGHVTHHVINVHVYEDQVELFKAEMEREPIDCEPVLVQLAYVDGIEAIDEWLSADNYTLEGYESHPAISYPFTA